jgi:nephrocystin-3
MNSLIVARGLDKIGLSASLCATPTNLDWAYIALKEALSIRICYLGPHHCDCADTLNNIAGVFMQKEDYETALGIYLDVLTIRAAIFGKNHPSIAITASTLGKVYQHLSDLDNALIHYNLAVAIYKGEPMNLKASHPLVSKVFKQISAIERLMVLLEEN